MEILLRKKFTRAVENFTCEKCATSVKGNGYTNHCPICLYSKHVDVNPGDRLEKCKGMMRPDEIITKKGIYAIVHKCEKCGAIKNNKLSESDNLDLFFKRRIYN